MAIQRFGDVAVDPETVVNVSKGGFSLQSKFVVMSSMVIVGGFGSREVIISDAAADALLKHFSTSPESESLAVFEFDNQGLRALAYSAEEARRLLLDVSPALADVVANGPIATYHRPSAIIDWRSGSALLRRSSGQANRKSDSPELEPCVTALGSGPT